MQEDDELKRLRDYAVLISEKLSHLGSKDVHGVLQECDPLYNNATALNRRHRLYEAAPSIVVHAIHEEALNELLSVVGYDESTGFIREDYRKYRFVQAVVKHRNNPPDLRIVPVPKVRELRQPAPPPDRYILDIEDFSSPIFHQIQPMRAAISYFVEFIGNGDQASYKQALDELETANAQFLNLKKEFPEITLLHILSISTRDTDRNRGVRILENFLAALEKADIIEIKEIKETKEIVTAAVKARLPNDATTEQPDPPSLA